MRLNLLDKGLISLFIYSRFVSLSQYLPAVVGGDSISYRNPNIDSIDSAYNYFPETLFGQSTRPFFPVTFFYFSGSDTRIVIFQSVFAILCWALFFLSTIIFLKYFLNNKAIIYLSLFFIMLVITNSQLIQYDRLIYSESLSFSAFSLYLSGVLLFLTIWIQFNKLVLYFSQILIFVGSILLATTKPMFVPIYFITFTLLFFSIKKFSSKQLFVSVFCLFTSLILVLQYNAQAFEFRNKGISYSLTSISYYLSTDNPLVYKYLEVYSKDLKLPNCAQVERPLNFDWEHQMFWGIEKTSTCPEIVPWAENFFPQSVFQLFKLDEGRFVHHVGRTFMLGLRGGSVLSVFSIFPESVNNLVLPSPSKNVGLLDQYESDWLKSPKNFTDPYFLLLFVTFMGLFAMISNRRKRADENNRNVFIFFGLFYLTLMAIWLIAILTIPGPPGEIPRLAILVNLISRLILIFLVSIIVDKYSQSIKQFLKFQN